MKIVERILYSILGLIILLSSFIIICAFSPELTRSITGALFGGSEEGADMSSAGTAANPDNEYPPNAGQYALAADEESGEGQDTVYRPPDKAGIKTPEALAGRSGYEPVREETEPVDENEAEQIKEQLTYGETGEDLNFDPLFYPYYDMLDETQQKLYRQIYANTQAEIKAFLPVVPLSVNQLHDTFLAVFNDHPELFWLDGSYSGKTAPDGSLVELDLRFNQTADDLEASKSAFNSAAEAILAQGREGSDYQKETAIHDALLNRVEYDLRAPLNQNAYSALVNGRTVCAGYARAYQYLMQQLQVPCYYCTGFAGENHAWNIIKLDNDFYNVDTTWDDTNPNTFDYYNKTDADFGGTHVREELSVYLPPCNGTAYGNTEESSKPQENIADNSVPGSENPITGDSSSAEDTMPEAEPAAEPAADTNYGYDNGAGQNQYVDNNARSLSEAGFSEDDVLRTMQDYYENCYEQIIKGGGSTTFENVIADVNMYTACANAYASGDFKDGFGQRVLDALSAAACDVSVIPEVLSDGRILLKHTVTISR